MANNQSDMLMDLVMPLLVFSTKKEADEFLLRIESYIHTINKYR